MMNLNTFLKLELKNFLYGRAVIAALVFLFLAGCYAMYYGKNFIAKQQEIISKVPSFQAEHFNKQFELNKTDLGGLLYYLQFDTTHSPSSWSAFSVGQRDVNPYNLKIKMLALEGQVYDSEISNPTNLLYGNFDLAFVIVFLFPLLIIALCHNLISSEQENGIWSLLRSQPVSLPKIIVWRLVLRFAFVLFLLFALLSGSVFYFQSAFDIRFAYALFIAFVYLAFWFALTAFVVSYQKSSTFNALSLLGVWIFLTILAPAFLNLVISTTFPVSESFDVTIKQREGYHQKWDRPKGETMNRFYKAYPEYKNIQIPENRFSWGWYYAMQQMGDEESANSTSKYIEKLEARNFGTNLSALFLPTVSTQLSFNNLAGNDLRSHLEYLNSVRTHHKNIREFFYPFIFNNGKIEDVNWENTPKHKFENELQKPMFPNSIWAVLLFSLLLSVFALRNYKEKLK